MKVLVTGGAGFIGSHIVDLFLERGNEVVVIDNLINGKRSNINKDGVFYLCNILDYDNMLKVFKVNKPEVVIHHAAHVSVSSSIKEPQIDALSNICGTINVLKCCKEVGVRKIIYASSAAAYGELEYFPVNEEHPTNPISFYGLSKQTCEEYIKLYGRYFQLNYTIFRYANVYGARQNSNSDGGVISILVDKFMNEEKITIYGDGKQTRDFIYVKDVALANYMALREGDNETINICSNKEISIIDLYQLIMSITKKDIGIKYLSHRSGDIYRSIMDNSKAVNILKWLPKYSLKDGLSELIRETYKICQK
ncbi:NAD-dependent epimerase/dehydratase family protein [Clostridium sp. JNZ J1-5]